MPLYVSTRGFLVNCDTIDDMIELSKLERGSRSSRPVVSDEIGKQILEKLLKILDNLEDKNISEEEFKKICEETPDLKLCDGATLKHAAEVFWKLKGKHN